MVRKVSLEIELPVSTIDGRAPLDQDRFRVMWNHLGELGWQVVSDPVNNLATGVCREVAIQDVLSNTQCITTDTGPIIEVVPIPQENIFDLQQEVDYLLRLAKKELESVGGMMICMGIHPLISDTEEEYKRYRTPRTAYDYAIKVRGWPHRKLVNIASTQEVIDVNHDEVWKTMRSLHRLSGLMVSIFRNAPDLFDHYDNSYCTRPRKWLEHVQTEKEAFGEDVKKVNIPDKEILSWQDYFDLIMKSFPMFILGTKKDGLFYLKDNPTFYEFISSGNTTWKAIDLKGNEIDVTPSLDAINCLDWTYFGFCRPRWRLKPDVTVDEFVTAYNEGKITEFMRDRTVKVLIENRSNATAYKDEYFASTALVLGLIENLHETEDFALRHPYAFWLELFELAQSNVRLREMHCRGVSVLDLAKELTAISRRGLQSRGLSEEQFLAPVDKTLVIGNCRAEYVRRLFDVQMGEMTERLAYIARRFSL